MMLLVLPVVVVMVVSGAPPPLQLSVSSPWVLTSNYDASLEGENIGRCLCINSPLCQNQACYLNRHIL